MKEGGRRLTPRDIAGKGNKVGYEGGECGDDSDLLDNNCLLLL
jgi:hypothetical protein